MGKLEEFVGFTINHDLAKITLNISQLNLLNNNTQEFNKDVKALMTLNTPDTPHKRIVRDEKIDVKI